MISLAEHHVHQLEAAADDAGAAEQRADLLGRGVGGHVEVLGSSPTIRSRTAPPTIYAS